jgi:hypothetical protein
LSETAASHLVHFAYKYNGGVRNRCLPACHYIIKMAAILLRFISKGLTIGAYLVAFVSVLVGIFAFSSIPKRL